jgi:hypothetical protein
MTSEDGDKLQGVPNFVENERGDVIQIGGVVRFV